MAESTEAEFRLQLNTLLSNAFSCLVLAIGEKLKLFNYLNETPQTSQRVADSARLKERYVREWLQCMVASQIVDVDNSGEMYFIKSQKINVLRSICDTNLMLPILAEVLDKVSDSFKIDASAGTEFSDYRNLYTIQMARDERMFNNFLMDKFIPSILGLSKRLETGINCLDFGGFHGTASYILAKHFPKSTFVVIDANLECVKLLRQRATNGGLKNIKYLENNIAKLPTGWSNDFDYVLAFFAMKSQLRPEVTVREVHRVLKPDGLFSIVEYCFLNDELVKSTTQDDSTELILQNVENLFHYLPLSLNLEKNVVSTKSYWNKETTEKVLTEVGFGNINFECGGLVNDNNNLAYHCLSKKI